MNKDVKGLKEIGELFLSIPPNPQFPYGFFCTTLTVVLVYAVPSMVFLCISLAYPYVLTLFLNI